MRVMQLDQAGSALRMVERATPKPKPGEVVIEVSACGVCRTDLHIIDGDLHGPLPIVPGHEVVGRVVALGDAVMRLVPGQRVGVPWLGRTCGECPYCRAGAENLCDAPQFTGFTRDGGYASHIAADARFCFPLPEGLGDAEVAPLLCAGLIGWRSLKMADDGRRLGLYGFGAAAHIVAQVAVWQGREVHAFTRAGDAAAQDFACSLGCAWAGSSDEMPPYELDAVIIFAPVGALIPAALKAVRKGGRVVCGGIHMSDVPSFPYALLWGERSVRSVANLTRADGEEFLAIAAHVPVRTSVETFPLAAANEALAKLRSGELQGAAVLTT